MTEEKKNEPATRALTILWSSYKYYTADFETITARARKRFEKREWKGMRGDILERLDLYTKWVVHARQELEKSLGGRSRDRSVWREIRGRYALFCRNRCDAELALTFYNSVNRKVFETVGIQPELEFLAPEISPKKLSVRLRLSFSIDTDRVDETVVREILLGYDFEPDFFDLGEDARLCVERIRAVSEENSDGNGGVPIHIEMIRHPFFRDTGAYLIGSLRRGEIEHPLVFVLNSREEGLVVDAMLLRQEQLRILFSFSREYFHVIAPCPEEIVRFLQRLMPEKRTAELYIALGHHKHGKTELYRDLLGHRRVCGDDLFDFSAGKRGMVMIAFNMSSDNLIYKIIRDRFDAPKKTTREQVMERYDYVFRHERAGRLVDVQTFENLQVEKCCFSPGLLEEIGSGATRAVQIDGDLVVLRHLFVERLVTPLDVFLEQADLEDAKAVVIDFGNAVKDLARVNVFPGDILVKNFGVTRLERVVFYDYDELCPLLDCNFRRMPPPRSQEEELSAEPWFLVSPNDVFPEQFIGFFGFSPELKEVFLRHHEDLLTPEFWRRAQDRIRSGKLDPILPYTEAQRLRPARPDARES